MAVNAPITFEQLHAVQVGQLGVHENPAKSNKTPYGAAFGMNGVAWCDIFQWWCSTTAGWKDAPKMSYTPTHAQWYKDRGAWLPASSWREAPKGSHVFFNFPGDGVDRISHIGWKEGTLDNGIATIEGNTNDAGGRTGGMVMRHNRTVAGGIVGFGVITYKTEAPASRPVQEDMPVIYRLKNDLVYQGVKMGAGFCTILIGPRRIDNPSAAVLKDFTDAGVPVLNIGSSGFAAVLDSTVTDIHRIITK